MPRESREKELRCGLCKFNPLLATYGVDKDGQLYVHIKSYKSQRIYTESWSIGDVRIRCRECHRIHNVKITQPSRAVLVETPLPDQPPLP